MQIRTQVGEDEAAGVVGVVWVGVGCPDGGDVGDPVVAGGVVWAGVVADVGRCVAVRAGVALAGLVAEPRAWLEFANGLDTLGGPSEPLGRVTGSAGRWCCPPENSVRAIATPAPATTQPATSAISQARRLGAGAR
jgi:hypothetical protein